MKTIPNKHRQLIKELDRSVGQFKSIEQKADAFLARHQEIRTDGWTNVLTKLGTAQDKRSANYASWELVLPETVAEDIYAGDSTARRIVDLLPNEAMRQWIEFEEEEGKEEIHKDLQRLQAKEKLHEAWIFARQYGGGGVLINDGTPIDKLGLPLDLDNVKKILSLTPLTRWELWAWATDVQRDITHPNFGQPTRYHMFPRMAFGQTGVTIHASRLIRFDGKRLPRLLTIRNNFWGDSVLTPLYEILGDFKTSYAAVAHVIQDYRVLVAKLKGLATTLVRPGGDDQVQKRVALLTQIRSMFGMAVIDSEDDFQFYSAKLEGLADLVDKVRERLQAETDIPHTILFNESPSGLGATGNSEEKVWYNHVRSQQENYLKPKLDQLFKVLFAQKQGPTKGKVPANWKYIFTPLWQMDGVQQAEMELKQAQADEINFDLGVKTNKQIQEKRFPELVDIKSENLPLPQPVEVPGATPKDKSGAAPKDKPGAK